MKVLHVCEKFHNEMIFVMLCPKKITANMGSKNICFKALIFFAHSITNSLLSRKFTHM